MAMPITLAAAVTISLAQPALAPFRPLLDHCWAGPAPGGQGIDTHCFEAILGGQHVRDQHSVKVGGKTVYAGETIYSARGAQVIFSYWNSLGGMGSGDADLSGDEWRFSGTIHATAAAAEQPMRAQWKMTRGGYDVSEGAGDHPRRFLRAK